MDITKCNPRYKANKRMRCGKRTVEQKEVDKTFCVNLFVKGYTYRQIADRLNTANKEKGLEYTLTFKTVFNDINEVLAEWKKERFSDIESYIQLELKKLDKMEVELWEAWEKSKKEKRKTTINGGVIDDNRIRGGVLDKRQIEDNNGNPRYLDLLLKVQERRAKLLGYNAPIKVDIYNARPEEKHVQNYDIKVLPTEMLVNMASMLQDAEFKRLQNEKEDNPQEGS